MGVGTHLEGCEFLLLKKYPDGLRYEEFKPELLKTGWPEKKDGRDWIDDNLFLIANTYKRNRLSEIEDDYGTILFNQERDKKYKFYPGYDRENPLAWRHSIHFRSVAGYLMDQEVLNKIETDMKLSSIIGVYYDIAKWFCNKFDMDFYSLCMIEYEKERKMGMNVKSPSKDLKLIKPKKIC